MLRFSCSRLFLRLAGVGILVAVAFVAGAWSAFTVIGPQTGMPTTCKELADKLQGQGLPIEWETYRDQSGMPSIVVFDHTNDFPENAGQGNCKHVRKRGLDRLKGSQTHYVIVTQYPTEELAGTQVGSDEDAWSYGRFVIWGLPGRFRDQVKAKLR